MSCPKIGLHKLSVKMDHQSYYFRKNYYSIELKHKICKEHLVEGVRLRDLVRKYNLSSHSLIHEWLRNVGYLAFRSKCKTISRAHAVQPVLAYNQNTPCGHVT